MRKSALVTGSSDRVQAVAAALEDEGFDVLQGERLQASIDLEPGSLDCYVQLAASISPRGETTVERVHCFLRDGLLARYEAAIRVMPALREGARVVLVGGHRPPFEAGPDAQYARTSLMNVLGTAMRADLTDRRVSVETLDGNHSPSAVASVAARGRTSRRIDYADYAPELNYDEWRLAVLSLDRMEA